EIQYSRKAANSGSVLESNRQIEGIVDKIERKYHETTSEEMRK
ncbi:hypothetical protein CP02DC18_1239, partial [Chlamydia psittaci 02DC18]